MTHELWACAYYSQHMSCSFVHVTCNTWPVVLCILCMTHDLWFVHNNYDSWAVILLVFFHNCIIPLGFLLLSLGKASCDSPTAQPTVHAGCFSVSIIHQTLTRTTGSLTCTQMLMYAVDTGVSGLCKRVCTKSTDTGRKIPRHTRGSGTSLSGMPVPHLFQLSYIPTPTPHPMLPWTHGSDHSYLRFCACCWRHSQGCWECLAWCYCHPGWGAPWTWALAGTPSPSGASSPDSASLLQSRCCWHRVMPMLDGWLCATHSQHQTAVSTQGDTDRQWLTSSRPQVGCLKLTRLGWANLSTMWEGMDYGFSPH